MYDIKKMIFKRYYHYIYFSLNSVAVEPGNQLLSPERKKNVSKGLNENEVDSNMHSK